MDVRLAFQYTTKHVVWECMALQNLQLSATCSGNQKTARHPLFLIFKIAKLWFASSNPQIKKQTLQAKGAGHSHLGVNSFFRTGPCICASLRGVAVVGLHVATKR